MWSYLTCFTLSMFVVFFFFSIRMDRVTHLPEGRVVVGHSCRADRDKARGMGYPDIKPSMYTRLTIAIGCCLRFRPSNTVSSSQKIPSRADVPSFRTIPQEPNGTNGARITKEPIIRLIQATFGPDPLPNITRSSLLFFFRSPTLIP